jgi:hypothetical protein
MKTMDFINFMDFSSMKKGGKGIGDNQCSFVVNEKNNTYYFRFKGSKFEFVKIGQLQGKVCFVLNKKEGVKGQIHQNSDSIAFTGKEMMFTILKIIHGNFNKSLFKGMLFLDKIEESEDAVIFLVKDIEVS